MLLICYAVAVAHGAKEWFVAVDGLPTNDGTIDSPQDIWSISKGSSGVLPGDTVYLRGGLYRVQRLLLEYSGTLEQPVIAKPYNREKVILQDIIPDVIRNNGQMILRLV